MSVVEYSWECCMMDECGALSVSVMAWVWVCFPWAWSGESESVVSGAFPGHPYHFHYFPLFFNPLHYHVWIILTYHYTGISIKVTTQDLWLPWKSAPFHAVKLTSILFACRGKENVHHHTCCHVGLSLSSLQMLSDLAGFVYRHSFLGYIIVGEGH